MYCPQKYAMKEEVMYLSREVTSVYQLSNYTAY